MPEGHIVSVQVGLPRTYRAANPQDDIEHEWESGIFKSPVSGPVLLGLVNLEGDGQSDLAHHGGPDRALLLYSAAYYPFWATDLGRELPLGAFGENLTVDGLNEDSVCLGDRWATDTIEIEVSQPRLPCFKVARRNEILGLNLKVIEHANGGWYARVLRQGLVSAGDVLRLVDRPHTLWTVRRAFRAYLTPRGAEADLADLATITQLSQLWKDGLARRLSK